jgi:hypothetical protein
MTTEERVERMLRCALDQLGEVDAEFRQRIREDLRCQVEYGGQYVAYFDEWLEGEKETPRRLIRHVLCQSPHISDVLGALQKQGRTAAQRWLVSFFQGPTNSTVMP